MSGKQSTEELLQSTKEFLLEADRFTVEIKAMKKCIVGVGMDGMLEATRRCIVDLLDAGHYPSRHMLHMICGELKQAWWPDRKPHQRNKETLWLLDLRLQTDYLAAVKYDNTRNPRTKAEADIARMRGISSDALRRKRQRYRDSLKESQAASERKRKRPLRK